MQMNSELTKENEDKDLELEQLKKTLEDTASANKLAAAQKKIRALQDRIKDVRWPSCL